MNDFITRIEPKALVFVHNKMFLESDLELPEEFWLELGENIYPILFQKVKDCQAPQNIKDCQGKYLAIAPHMAHSAGLSLRLLPRVCLQGVWWTRRAAVEADQCISAYRQAVGWND